MPAALQRRALLFVMPYAVSVSHPGANGSITARNNGSSRYSYLSFSSYVYFQVNTTAASNICFWKQTNIPGSSVTYYTTE